jgi:hypothetical protein
LHVILDGYQNRLKYQNALQHACNLVDRTTLLAETEPFSNVHSSRRGDVHRTQVMPWCGSTAIYIAATNGHLRIEQYLHYNMGAMAGAQPRQQSEPS